MHYKTNRKYRIVEFENGKFGFQYRDEPSSDLERAFALTLAGRTKEPPWAEDPQRFPSPEAVREHLNNINIKRVVEEL